MSSEFHEIFDRFLQVYGVKAKRGLARCFGITPQSVSSVLSRRKIPDSWYRRAAEDFDVRRKWLETGEEPKFRAPDPTIRTLPKALQELFDLSKDSFDESDYATLRHIARILHRRRDTANHIKRQAQIIDETEEALEEKEQTIKRLEERLRRLKPHLPPAPPPPHNPALLQVADVARRASRRGAPGRRRPPRPCPE